MSDALPVLYRQDLGININAAALAQKEAAIERAALIGRVTTPEEQAEAVDAQVDLAKLVKATEASRKEVKAPIIEAGKMVDSIAKSFVAEIEAETMRLAKLNADYASLLLANERSAEASRNATLSDLERRREEELAAATSHEERDEIAERYNELAKSVPVVEVSRAEGQVVRKEWDVTVTDVHALYRAHPHCCKVTPLLSEIKALLDDGIVVRGVKAERVVKSGVRTAV